MSPADLLREYAALLEYSTATTMTEAGHQLDTDLTKFLGEVIYCEETEAIYDLFMLTARAFFAIHLAHHGGDVDRAALNEHMLEFGRAVAREHHAFNQTIKKGMN